MASSAMQTEKSEATSWWPGKVLQTSLPADCRAFRGNYAILPDEDFASVLLLIHSGQLLLPVACLEKMLTNGEKS